MIPISVIVPIFNMEKLMRKCLDSILAQTFTDYECLLIDDGSKDGSPAICDEYAAKDSRFKAFHKPNGGLSDARNYGLAHAQGEYTIFFDPDDWVDEDCLKDMYAKAKETNADLVMCDYFNEDPYRRQYTKQTPTSLNHDNLLKDVITGKIYGYTWNKLLKKDLYSRYQLQYPKGMYGCEDQYTMCALLKNAIKVTYLPKAYYHYMHYGNETQSRKYDDHTYQMMVQTRDLFYETLKDTKYAELAYSIKTFHIIGAAFLFGYRNYSSREFVDVFTPYKWVLDKVPLTFWNKMMYKLCFMGLFRETRYVYEGLYRAKQILKKYLKKYDYSRSL